jgi:hypothetical protein
MVHHGLDQQDQTVISAAAHCQQFDSERYAFPAGTDDRSDSDDRGLALWCTQLWCLPRDQSTAPALRLSPHTFSTMGVAGYCLRQVPSA